MKPTRETLANLESAISHMETAKKLLRELGLTAIAAELNDALTDAKEERAEVKELLAG